VKDCPGLDCPGGKIDGEGISGPFKIRGKKCLGKKDCPYTV